MNTRIVSLLFAMLFAFALCENESNTIQLHVFEGSTKWWLAVDPRNETLATTSVEVREYMSLRWVPAVASSNLGYFQLSSGARAFSMPLSFRLTATNGNKVVARDVMRTIEADSLVDTFKQYSKSVPTQTPTSSPTPAPSTATSSPTKAPAATATPAQKATAAPSATQAPISTTSPTMAPPPRAPTQKATSTSSPTQAPATRAPAQSSADDGEEASAQIPPTVAPTKASTTAPSATQGPTSKAATQAPTQKAATQAPATVAPTQKAATQAPTQIPATAAPTKTPTQAPTAAPTKAPTAAPVATLAPTKAPTQLPLDLCTVTSAKSEAVQIMVPLYVYPGAAWDQLIQVAKTGVKIIAIINPNSGPLPTGPDAAYTTYMKKLQDAGIDMVGYVHTLWGARDENTVHDEVNLWANKYTGIKGIFFDEGATAASAIPFYTSAYNLVISKGWIHSILNPGAQPDQGYLAISSNIVIFENYGTELNKINFSSWITCAPNAAAKAGYKYKFTSMAHTATMADMPALIADSHKKGMGVVYITDGLGGCCTYNELAAYFVQEGSSVRTFNNA